MYGASTPADACVAPMPTGRSSTISTDAPRRASSWATAQPMMPAPTTMMSEGGVMGSFIPQRRMAGSDPGSDLVSDPVSDPVSDLVSDPVSDLVFDPGSDADAPVSQRRRYSTLRTVASGSRGS